MLLVAEAGAEPKVIVVSIVPERVTSVSVPDTQTRTDCESNAPAVKAVTCRRRS